MADAPYTTAIIQARMGSTRLPGKVLMPLAGRPALWHIVDRLSYSNFLKKIVIATTTNPLDDAIVEFCKKEGIDVFRGSEEDVLDRYYQAAKRFDADPIVRITADCPVIDPFVLDEVLERFFQGNYDVYGLAGEFPDGLDCGAFRFWVLEDTWENASLPSEREHVGPYMAKHPEKYKIGGYEKFKGLGHHRWTLDEEADYKFLSMVFDKLYKPEKIFLTRDILELLEREPELTRINYHIMRNEGYLKSLKKDEKFLESQ